MGVDLALGRLRTRLAAMAAATAIMVASLGLFTSAQDAAAETLGPKPVDCAFYGMMTGSPVLKNTSSDRGCTAALQLFLRSHTGWPAYLKFLTLDGSYGPQTRTEVSRFQWFYGLTNDGIVGRSTWTRIYNICNGWRYSRSYSDRINFAAYCDAPPRR